MYKVLFGWMKDMDEYKCKNDELAYQNGFPFSILFQVCWKIEDVICIEDMLQVTYLVYILHVSFF